MIEALERDRENQRNGIQNDGEENSVRRMNLNQMRGWPDENRKGLTDFIKEDTMNRLKELEKGSFPKG